MRGVPLTKYNWKKQKKKGWARKKDYPRKGMFNGFSGVTIYGMIDRQVFAYFQAISWSTNRSASPIYTQGIPRPIIRPPRTAGTIICLEDNGLPETFDIVIQVESEDRTRQREMKIPNAQILYENNARSEGLELETPLTFLGNAVIPWYNT